MPRKSSAAVAFSSSTASRLKPPDDLVGDARKQFVDLVLGLPPGSLPAHRRAAAGRLPPGGLSGADRLLRVGRRWLCHRRQTERLAQHSGAGDADHLDLFANAEAESGRTTVHAVVGGRTDQRL